MREPVGIHIFSNGFELDCWEERNCNRCVKEPTCDLLAALFTDGLEEGLYQGQVKPETAARLGYTDEYRGVLGWPCREREPGPRGRSRSRRRLPVRWSGPAQPCCRAWTPPPRPATPAGGRQA